MEKGKQQRAVLGIAAMLNGCIVDSTWLHDPATMLLYSISDYFTYQPLEAAQFDRADMEALVRQCTSIGVMQLLHGIGKSPYETNLEEGGERWERAANGLQEGEWPCYMELSRV